MTTGSEAGQKCPLCGSPVDAGVKLGLTTAYTCGTTSVRGYTAKGPRCEGQATAEGKEQEPVDAVNTPWEELATHITDFIVNQPEMDSDIEDAVNTAWPFLYDAIHDSCREYLEARAIPPSETFESWFLKRRGYSASQKYHHWQEQESHNNYVDGLREAFEAGAATKGIKSE